MIRLSIALLSSGLLILELSVIQKIDLSFEYGRLVFFILLGLSVLAFMRAVFFGHKELLGQNRRPIIRCE